MVDRQLDLEEIQQGSFQVLLKLKEIFDEHGWKYYLAYGTLIGAVRHKGFIPWDDDIDVWVPRKDYDEFVAYCIANSDNMGYYKLMHHSTNKKYIYGIARFTDTRFKINYKNVKDYGLGLFVDLYPMDGYNTQDIAQIKQLKRIQKNIGLCGLTKMPRSNGIIKNILKYPVYLFFKLQKISKLLTKNDVLAKKYDYSKYDTIGCLAWESRKRIYYKSDFGDGLLMKFNNEDFCVPIEYDKILKMLYGNYMELPPESEQIAHHFYEVYKKN